MERIERSPTPPWLAAKWKEWGKKWEVKYEKTKSSSEFKWKKHQKKSATDLRQALSDMTARHCSFCDSFPMGPQIPETIEHFRPKTKYPRLAYHWYNLFLCCGLCQQKGDEFSKELLKPDQLDYSFDRYFEIDWFNGKLIPNHDADPSDRKRAQTTIELYRLNDHGKPEDRLREMRMFEDSKSPSLNDFAYRFFLTRGC